MKTRIAKKSVLVLCYTLVLCLMSTLHSQTMPPSFEESAKEPIKYIGEQQTDPNFHHGSLRHAVGVHRYQVMRANREHPTEIGSETGWTYNHQPYLCYWNDKYYLQYLSNPLTEHVTPGRTVLMVSKDGRNFSPPEIIFPEYALPEIEYKHPDSGQIFVLPEGTKAVMHQRNGFYISKDNRLLTMAFYSYCPNPRIGPNNGQGLGRVIREIYKDGSYGPIYFIRYNRHAGWNEENTSYPFYKTSEDAGFVKACDELLADKLVTLQWWEEDRAEDGFYTIKPGGEQPKAFSYLRRPDDVIVGIWKHQLTALSKDEGNSWTDLALSKTLMTCGAKTWGQNTEDGKYALVYNHSATRRNRWPMVVMTSEDGYHFDNMLCLHGEVSPMRYYGWAKNQGPQYIRGIFEGLGDPPGKHMWNTYSMNKEDMWVTRTRLPITGTVSEQVNQDFEGLKSETELEWWNFHILKWAPIEVVSEPEKKNQVLQLSDEEPYEYAVAERHFPVTDKAIIEFDVMVKEQGKDVLELELHNQTDQRALRIRFDAIYENITFDVGGVEPWPVVLQAHKWYHVKLVFDCDKGRYDFWLDGKPARENIELDIETDTLERMVFRTGSWRSDVRLFLLPGQPSGPGMDTENLAAAGEKVAKSVFWIDNVKTSTP